MTDPLDGFAAPTRSWFRENFAGPTSAQKAAWPLIRSGQHCLIVAPTGSGKTLAAFLSALDRLLFAPRPERDHRCRVLYLSPLKALAVDVEKNLARPIQGVQEAARLQGVACSELKVSMRTGDTPPRDRARFLRDPGDILITTPESLFLILTSQARERLRSVDTVIVDEIHAVLDGKRGAHLALSLERLEELCDRSPQRIGLSATVEPIEEAATFLGGFGWEGEKLAPRPVITADGSGPKSLELSVRLPTLDLNRALPHVATPDGTVRDGIWPSLHPFLLDQIQEHRSTLFFVNSRRVAERLAQGLNDLAGTELVKTHHGSVSREQRQLIEEDLKQGRLPALIATSTLELGIDMGAIDLVVQIEAPGTVASGLQRVGRAGHSVGATSRGVLVARHRGDLLTCAAIAKLMHDRAVEPIHFPRNPLDVLAQQIVAMVSVESLTASELGSILRRAAPYTQLPDSALTGVLDMVSGRYPSDDFAELKPRIHWNRETGELTARPGARSVVVANAGSIPDRGLYGVYFSSDPTASGRVGELDEEMVLESRVGDVFVLGSTSWRITDINQDRVLVEPAGGHSGRMPFWHGDRQSRSLPLGRAVGELSRRVREHLELGEDAVPMLQSEYFLDSEPAENLVEYLRQQLDAVGSVPDDRTVILEQTRDDLFDWRVCLLTPFGSRVTGAWAMAIAARWRAETGQEMDLMWSDDGIVARFGSAERPPDPSLWFPEPEEVEDLIVNSLLSGGAAREYGQGAPVNLLFAGRFREAAARSLLLPRRRPGKRSPFWQQRKRAADLLHATRKYTSFPIVLEALRECLQEHFDVPSLKLLLTQIRGGEVRTVTVESQVPSPFSSQLLFSYVANFMYEGDATLAERRADTLRVDAARLRELLGEVDFRSLLSPESMADIEDELQGLVEDRLCANPDQLLDRLLVLGDLSLPEIELRSAPASPVGEWLRHLAGQRLVIEVELGETRWIALEDASNYRQALGVKLPDLPVGLLPEPFPDPLHSLVRRWSRTHGPFTTMQLADRWGLGSAVLEPVLLELESRTQLLRGEFRPNGAGEEWCHPDVLRRIQRRTAERLRSDAAPVRVEALIPVLLQRHGIDDPPSGREALLAALEQLHGVVARASEWESWLLPARVADYRSSDLDALLSEGLVWWQGVGAASERDGLLRFWVAGLPCWGDGDAIDSEAEIEALRARLRSHGAQFFRQLVEGVPGVTESRLVELIWRLAWAGELTNDGFAAVRAQLMMTRVTSNSRRPRLMRRELTPPQVSGRWYLVESGNRDTATCLLAQLDGLFQRCGLVHRDLVRAEGLPGGWAGIYPHLRDLEMRGQLRRGYFVEGLGATQFATADTVQALRGMGSSGANFQPVFLAAADPANPYGQLLPWPVRTDQRRPNRLPGARVLLSRDGLMAWIPPQESMLLTAAGHADLAAHPDLPQQVAQALRHGWVELGRPPLTIETIDSLPARATPFGRALEEVGFTYGPRGYLIRG